MKKIFDSYKIHIILGVIIVFIVASVFIDLLFVRKPKEDKASEITEVDELVINNGRVNNLTDEDTDTVTASSSVNGVIEYRTLLDFTPDTKDGYMNNCIFLGDSRTVAMVMNGFVNDDNVLAEVGIAHTNFMTNVFTMKSGQQYTLDSYLDVHKAPVIYIGLGVNGMDWIAPDTYREAYRKLVLHVMEKCPDSKIVIQAIWPVEDDGPYAKSVQNSKINEYNEFLYELASELGIYYLDVDVLLKDEDGTMKNMYNGGDGLHYQAAAYTDILKYIIHHAVPGISDEGEFVVKYVAPTAAYIKANSHTSAGATVMNNTVVVSENELEELEELEEELEEPELSEEELEKLKELEEKEKEEEEKKKKEEEDRIAEELRLQELEEQERLEREQQEEEERQRKEEEERKRKEEEKKRKEEEEKQKEEDEGDEGGQPDAGDTPSEDNPDSGEDNSGGDTPDEGGSQEGDGPGSENNGEATNSQ